MSSRRLLCAFVPLVLLAAAPASAQRSRADARVLNGHAFMPSGLIEQPFNVRDYGMYVGVGYATADAPGLEEPLTFAALSLAMQTQQPVWRMIALRLALDGTALVGTDATTGLQYGAVGAYNVAGGILVNAVDLDIFSLSASLDIGGGQAYQLSPVDAIEDSIAAGQVTASELVSKTNQLDVTPTLSLGVGFFEAMGMYAALAYSFVREDGEEGTSNANNFSAGLGLSLNFDPYGVPLGLNFAYQYVTEFGKDEGLDTITTNSIEVGLYYAAGKHFAFGLAGAIQLAKFDPSQFELNNYIIQLGMEYYE